MEPKTLLFYTLSIVTVTLALTEPATYFLHKGVFNAFESSLLEPLFFISSALSISFVCFVFFSNQMFTLWLRKFLVWFLPLSVLIIATGSIEVSYGWPTRTDFAVNLGILMVVATLLFVVVQRFYYKVR